MRGLEPLSAIEMPVPSHRADPILNQGRKPASPETTP